jgi:hypothetical protein
MSRILLCGAAVIATLSGGLLAQGRPDKDVKTAGSPRSLIDPLATTCQATFTSGSGNSFLRWCVTINGNLINFESPAGLDHIANIEGYALCTPFSDAFDAAAVGEAGFAGNGIILAQNASSITIQRDTADRRLRLLQTFTRDTNENDVTITVTVTNRSDEEIFAPRFSRYADFDIDLTSGADVFSSTLNGVWADESHGITLSAISFKEPLSNVLVERFTALVNGTAAGCDGDLKEPLRPPTVGVDAVARVTYFLRTLLPGQSRTVKYVYRRQ